ncbi:hypothetical protein [Streptomyces sp. MNU103]|uniref:hypothetical protein n=1 Tax=Streptomyces sp. MNU103 TaxID=2560024 RepID=UPI00307B7A19
MNTSKRQRRWWPRSVRARAALAAALTAAVVLSGIGWWVHQEIYRQSLSVAEEKARNDLFALVDQLKQGDVPGPRRSAPYEVVATGRRTAVAAGGGMEAFDRSAGHVLPSRPRSPPRSPRRPTDGNTPPVPCAYRIAPTTTQAAGRTWPVGRTGSCTTTSGPDN